MEFDLLGWPAEGPTLRLDYRRFSYAGKFVMSNTGKAVVSEPESATTGDDSEREEEIVAAAAFDADRTDDSTLRIRYVTVREDRRGEGIGSRLLRTVCECAADRGFETVKIAVNNPFAYEAAVKAGFGYTGQRTGIAERVMAWPCDDRSEQYSAGLESYRERDLLPGERTFLDERDGVPTIVEPL
ncbi:MAG: GNAT family N-acetyltransferase [Halapricum sp.]